MLKILKIPPPLPIYFFGGGMWPLMAPVLIYQTLYLNIKLIFHFGYKEDILLGLKINILAAPLHRWKYVFSKIDKVQTTYSGVPYNFYCIIWI